MYEVFEKLLKVNNVKAADVSKATGIRQGVFSDWKAGRYTPKMDKMQKIADYFGVTVEYLTGVCAPSYTESDDVAKQMHTSEYYNDDATAEIAQQIFENPELRVLFDAAKDATPEDLQTTYDMLMALKRKEKGDTDDPA